MGLLRQLLLAEAIQDEKFLGENVILLVATSSQLHLQCIIPKWHKHFAVWSHQ
jgi:hypothetical protein